MMSRKPIKGLEKLTDAQITHLAKCNGHHVRCAGEDYEATETWVDERGTVCARVENGEWYHYYSDGTWG